MALNNIKKSTSEFCLVHLVMLCDKFCLKLDAFLKEKNVYHCVMSVFKFSCIVLINL